MFHAFLRTLCALMLVMPSFSAHAAEPDWSDYAQLLKKHVSSGEIDGVKLNRVNYTAWKDDPLWPKVISQLEAVPADELKTREDKLAFYINAYNILAIKMVLDNWPADSIKDAGSLIWPVWRKNVGKLHGKTVTLQGVEDDLIRTLNEPRIHMAIVCASVSCPDLRAEPYRVDTLDAQLDDQSRQFINNNDKGVSIDGNTVHTTQIFDWFEKDFAPSGGVEAFIRKYRELPANVKIKTDIDYNWNLNGT